MVRGQACLKAKGMRAHHPSFWGNRSPRVRLCSRWPMSSPPAVVKVTVSGTTPSVVPLMTVSLEAPTGRLRDEEVRHPPIVPEVPSSLARRFGPEEPKEVAAPLGATDEALRRLWSILREVGLSMEPGFKV